MRFIICVMLLIGSFGLKGSATDSENTAFRNVKVVGGKGNYLIIGETRANHSGMFFYTVEDGHNEFISEKQVHPSGNNHSWKPFKIELHIQKRELPLTGSLIIHFYERNKVNKMINSYLLILERF